MTADSHPPSPPEPPVLQGYLKKLKRKTSIFSGGYNKRWFFVDTKHLEFGYAKSSTPNAPRSSIYLNDISAVIQFDETRFQVESRTRNFFLCGANASTTTHWVRDLEDYRMKLAQYEKDRLYWKICMDTAASVDTNQRNETMPPEREGTEVADVQVFDEKVDGREIAGFGDANNGTVQINLDGKLFKSRDGLCNPRQAWD